MKIGISGGTFDPVHYGHLIAAEEARQQLGLERVIFIPAGLPPHKTPVSYATGLHRYHMVCAAIITNKYFEASDIEISRPGYTYSIDTLEQLAGIYGNTVRFYFITGADVVCELLTWKEYKKIFEMCDFVAVMRPGCDYTDFSSRIEKLRSLHGANVHTIESPLIGISSTAIRSMVRCGMSIKYLVPENVEKYIYEHGLYR